MQLAPDEFPDKLPLLPLKDIVVFPQMILPVFVAEDICLKAVEQACAKDRLLFLSAFQAEPGGAAAEGALEGGEGELGCSTPPPFDVYDVGTIAVVMRTRKLPDGRTKVLVQGVAKAQVQRLRQSEPFPMVEITKVIDLPAERGPECEALMRSVREQLEKLVSMGRSLSPDILLLLEDVTDAGRLADLVASHLGLKIADAQRILSTLDPLARLRRVSKVLARECEVFNMQVKIQSQAREEMSRGQREHFLREQLRAIRSELGELDGKDELEDLRERAAKSGMTPEALTEANKQIRRLERMNQDSSEAAITRTYIEWMCDLPWAAHVDPKIDIHACKKTLDEDHFGLDKVKDRVLEYISVKKLNPGVKGPILCLYGPPGVGKTSLGRSIAKALGRKFARISLGGVRDEAEIRGHRRTYVGAQPGRVIQALKNAGTKNPVIMLDEIDKLGADYKGDPASALLEVLDPEQNNSFSDHYINVPFDLSQVMFIANANRLDTIPAPLRDRLEIIEVTGYSEEEKIEIAKHYIIPKTIEQAGLKPELMQIADPTIALLVNGYTRESGLRNLEKTVATIARKLARQVAESDEKGKERKPFKVTPKAARDMLGEEKFLGEDHDTTISRIGVATGLAYTQHGGEILTLEVNLVAGKGGLTLTGQLGDVMKESAQAALSYVRSRALELGIDPEEFNKRDCHLHVPAGAIPKDGPSAGVAIATALVSAFRGVPLRQDVGMTGEITLHGRVLPIGGLREKVLAALRVGLATVCVPEKNRAAIAELPISIRRRIDIRFVRSFDELLAICLDPAAPAPAGRGAAAGLREVPQSA